MTKPLHASFVTIVDGPSKQGFKPQFFACLQGQSIGSTRIELFKSEEQAKSQQAASRLIVIKPNIAINVSKEKHAFTIGSTTVMTQSDADLKQWLTKIYQAQPTVKGLSEYSLQIYDEVTDPKNDLGPFLVTLQQTEQLSFYGPCQLEIQPKISERLYYVTVYDMNQPPRLIIRWQIDHLRGYGSNESVLKVQTGRRTPTGVSTFIFQTSDGARIHQAIHYWAEIITNKSHPTAATPDVSVIPPSRDKLPAKPKGGGPLPPRGADKKVMKDPVMQASSAYQPLIAMKKPVGPPTYESMRPSPSKTSNLSADTINSPTATTGGTYEPLNVNGHDMKQQTYQPLTRDPATQRMSMYEDVTPKPTPPPKDPTNSAGGYAALGPRDETKTPYMTVSHTT